MCPALLGGAVALFFRSVRNFLLTKRISLIFLLFIFLSVEATFANQDAELRIGDLLQVNGIRNRQIIGYGLVVGLKGSGDSRRYALTNDLFRNLMSSMGHNVAEANLVSRNAAVVMVTAMLPPFAGNGDALDLIVASVGDARSLDGGLLLQTPLYGGNRQIYATGQGRIVMKQASGNRRSEGANIGSILRGGIVEKDMYSEYVSVDAGTTNQATVTLRMQGYNFAVMNQVREIIEKKFTDVNIGKSGANFLQISMNPGLVISRMSAILNTKIKVPGIARVVIDEENGVLVIGSNVKVAPVALAVRGFSQIDKSQGDSVSSLYGQDSGKEKGKALFLIEKTADFKEIVTKMNSLGLGAKELFAIFRAMEKSGALRGELITR